MCAGLACAFCCRLQVWKLPGRACTTPRLVLACLAHTGQTGDANRKCCLGEHANPFDPVSLSKPTVCLFWCVTDCQLCHSCPCVLCRLQSLTTKIWQHAHNILTVCTLISLCIGSCHCQATAGSAKPDVLSPPTGSNQHLLSGCNEVGILKSLGWYQAYKPEGYSLNTRLPNNCSTATWQSLGCLASLVSLTLTGSLPHLPDHWWTNGSFSNLQVFNFSATKLAGTLPASWA